LDIEIPFQKSYDSYHRCFDMQALVSVSEDLDEEAVDKLHLPVIRSDSETYVRSPIIGPPTRPELKDVLTLSRSAGCSVYLFQRQRYMT
jgi:hypothetical protein